MDKVKLLPIKNQKFFNKINSCAIKFSCKDFILLISPLPQDYHKYTKKKISSRKHILYGFKISRKFGKSVKRNLLKRRVKHILHKNLANNYIPISLIFIPKKNCQQANFQEIENSFINAIKWAGKKLKLHHINQNEL